MTRILLVTNDFPPRRGGIQSYLEQFAVRLADSGEHTLTVYAPTWKGAEDYDRAAPFHVVRHPGTLMLPEPGVDRRRYPDGVVRRRGSAGAAGGAGPLRRRPAGAGLHPWS